jgi:hypothetical protein
MPESPQNPFREEPTGLNKDDEKFFADFVPGFEPNKSAQAGEGTVDIERHVTNDEADPESLDIIVDEAERGLYDNAEVEMAGVIITNREKRQVEEILTQINENRRKNGLEEAELGKEIKLQKPTIGGKTKEQLGEEMKQRKIEIINSNAIWNHQEFTIQKIREAITLIELSVADLVSTSPVTTREIIQAMEKFGLEECPNETGLHLRLGYQEDQSLQTVGVVVKGIYRHHTIK